MSLQTAAQVVLWDKAQELEVVFDCYEGESVLPEQEHALQMILENWKVVNEALPQVQHFIEVEGDIAEVTDVYEYIQPTALFIKRTDDARVVAIMCDSELDPEHGAAIVFKDEAFSMIAQQGDVL